MKTIVAIAILAVAIVSPTLAIPRAHGASARARQYHQRHHIPHLSKTRIAEMSVQCPPTNDPNSWAIHLPNPEDCGSYYVCDWGTPVLMPCPAGLHFNPELQVCDWPENAGCTVGQQPSTAAPAKTTEAAVVTDKPEETEAPATVKPDPTTLKPEDPTTPKPEDPTTPKPAEVTTEEPVPETTLPEEPAETTLPEEPAEETTQPEEPAEETTQPADPETTAKPAEPTEKPGPECPPVGTAILPNPDDCETFYVCSNGIPILVTCPYGKAFDMRVSSCTEAAENQCKKPEEPTPAPEEETPEPEVVTTETPEEVTTVEPEEEVTTVEPEEEVTTIEPEEEVTTVEPEEEVTTIEPEEVTDEPEEITTLPPEEEVTTPRPVPTTEKPADPTTLKPADPTTAAPQPPTGSPDPTKGCELVTCPALNGEYALHLPNPLDCGSFCKCDWGTAYYFACPGGLHFNADLQVCDWPASANCHL